jgi:hypothetical protein
MELEAVHQLVDALFVEKFNRHLTDPEITVLQGTWEGATYVKMSRQSQYSENYLMRDIGPNLFRRLTQALGEEVSKANLRAALERHSLGLSTIHTQFTHHWDWDNVPESSAFYGREQELQELTHAIQTEQCRLVQLSGMGGVGKTQLVRKCAEALKGEFRYVIWRSLHQDTCLESLVLEWLHCLAPRGEARGETPGETREVDLAQNLLELIFLLKQYRCLLILDNVSEVLNVNAASTPQQKQAANGFRQLFQRVGEKSHKSCVLILTRHKISTIASWETPQFIRSIHLPGLNPVDAQALLAETQLQQEKSWPQLIELARGVPLALKLISQSILDLFDGNVTEFLKHKTWIFDSSLSRILADQFAVLSTLEQEIITHLVRAKNPISLENLEGKFPGSDISFVMEALLHLIRMDWLEKVEHSTKTKTEIRYQAPFLIKTYLKMHP